MKKIFLFQLIFIILFFQKIYAQDIGQTEITAEEGIEVFQQEKYYLLKKNVKINSENFNLSADIIKAYFEKDLYDIIKIEAESNAFLSSSKGVEIKGQKIYFDIKKEIVNVFGENSLVKNLNIRMSSNQSIQIDNINGNFELNGKNSVLKTADTYILGEYIKGKFINIDDKNVIENLLATDQSLVNFKNEKVDMFSKRAIYNKNENTIELFDNVKIISDGETILGDYAIINTLNKSYKVNSQESKKVKILINNTDE